MNSSEQKDFEHPTPTPAEIESLVGIIRSRLALPQMQLAENDAIREGYLEAVKILTSGDKGYDQISKDLQTDHGKVIAVHAVDYLNGECGRDMLVPEV